MKKIILVLSIFLSLCSLAFDDVPNVSLDMGRNVNYGDSQDALINVDKMKKADKVKEAKETVNKNKKPILRLDTKEIIHQQVLDYTTDQTNSVIPFFHF